MDSITKHYDRIILAVLGLLVAVFAGLIILNALSFNEIFESRNSSKPPSDKITEPETAIVRQEIVSIQEPAEWVPHEGSLFVSAPYVLQEDGQLTAPLEAGSVPLHPPVPNEWLVKYDLDWADGNVLEADPDNDKFSNREEWAGNTDPTSAKSRPPYITKLRLAEFVQTPFRLKFSGSPDQGTTFTINARDLSSPTQFLKLGEMVDGTPYKLINYEEKNVDKDGLIVDTSELTIENQENREKIVLIFDREVNSPTEFAKLRYLWDGSEQTVKKGDDFSVEPEPNVKYKLVDITETEALIQNAETGQEFKVPSQDP